ncbi:CHC2 zinc finger domain-containing protein [Celeribacter sp.]|uniref:CHC2 zinc finger domain-containing protein n=1 Tax=Celeribacter sp. TaxID=1890673 RepID=UPI003A9570ED
MGVKESTAALNRLTLKTVGSFLGIQLPAKGMVQCPLPNHDDGTPSFEIRHEGRRWVCYACNLSGGAIDFVMAYHNTEFMVAKTWLMDKCGYAIGGNKRHPSGTKSTKVKPRPQPIEKYAEVHEFPPDKELYQELLARAPLRKTGLEYLQGRGISNQIINRFSIGQMPSTSVVHELVKEFGFERVETSGLLTKNSTPNWFRSIFPQDAVLFPYIEGGEITYFQSRGLTDTDKSNRWRNLNHRRMRIYNVDTLRDSAINRIAICEGVLDAISSTQLGCEAIGFIGASAPFSGRDMISLRGKQVEILLDWDNAGENRAAALRKDLNRFGVSATRRFAPRSGAKDVNDYLREGHTSL